jgi:4-hydroxy-3-polyprenylbenzoate decarboxylase
MKKWTEELKIVLGEKVNSLPLLVMTDDADFVAETYNNFLWSTFTRANPSHDIYGIDSFIKFKHWGCKGPLLIDTRIKPHHAPPLLLDDEVEKRVDKLFSEHHILKTL